MVDRWIEITTERERVESIARTLTEPKTVEWVADQVKVEPESAEVHLENLTEYGFLLTTDNGKFIPDPTWLYFDQLRELILSNSKEDLRSEVESIDDAVDSWQTEYGVTTPDELEASLSDDLDLEDIQERKWVSRQWDSSLHARELIRTALVLYDEVHSLAENVPDTTIVDKEE